MIFTLHFIFIVALPYIVNILVYTINHFQSGILLNSQKSCLIFFNIGDTSVWRAPIEGALSKLPYYIDAEIC